MSPTEAPYNEHAATEEMLFALARRDQPTVAFVECASLAKRNELEILLAERLPEYQFHSIDVTPFPVVSLLRTLDEQLPEAVKTAPPVTHAVNVHGLENSLLVSQDGRLVPSLMTAQLNLERELLFRSVPYIIILWGDAHFFRTLQREAPDLWHWVTYKFRFEDHTARTTEELPPLPPKRLPQRGNVRERQARIQELEDRYEHMALDTGDKKRLLKDKVDILSLLAEEYSESFLFDKAEESYKIAISLQKIIHDNSELRAKLYFSLGNVCYDSNKLTDALHYCEQCRELASKQNIGAILLLIGAIYTKQKNWQVALEHYGLVVQWCHDCNKQHKLGSVYHQIAILYQMQRQWIPALEHYQQALDWDNRAGMTSQIGITYHQIGRLYSEQLQWPLAIVNYTLSLDWKKQVGDVFEQATTYKHIGLAYEEMGELDLALNNYNKAFELCQETGNDYNLGDNAYYIGGIYAAQGAFEKAVQWISKSIIILKDNNHPNLSLAQETLSSLKEHINF